MAEVKTYTFAHKEVVEALIKRQGLREGIWQLYVEFGLAAANINQGGEGGLLPAAIVPILKIGLNKVEKESELTVDAAKINSP